MMERLLRIWDKLIEVSCDESFALTVNTTKAFKNKIVRYCKQMKQTNYYTKYLQTKELSLNRCRDFPNVLIEDVQEGFNNPDSDLYRCFLGRKYITSNPDILPDPEFKSGICKIQNH